MISLFGRFSHSRQSDAMRTLLARRHLDALTDEAIDELAEITVKNWRFQQQANKRNREPSRASS